MNNLMQCGCAANARDEKGNPVCVVHLGIVEGADKVAEVPNLTGRRAQCCYNCGSEVDSSLDLAFFEYLPDNPTDRYYCGCWGWE